MVLSTIILMAETLTVTRQPMKVVRLIMGEPKPSNGQWTRSRTIVTVAIQSIDTGSPAGDT